MITSIFRSWFRNTATPTPDSIMTQAERGDANAQFDLGLRFANGKGPGQDYSQAAQWYLKAAEQSHVLAQFNLAVMYAEGQGMPVDKDQSLLWLGRAAKLGDAAAQHRLGIVHHRASLERFPVNASESRIEAYKWLQLADDKGYRDSDMARGLVVLQMTWEEVTDGNRRVADFVAAPPGATPEAVT
ncbi:MAG TPA: tetratricopeptide repeat protein [Verrucomicrobiae bacterium]|nr:tetratricopeptide repeat protein [Verrucomicrobiae bacterium]